MQRGRGVKNNFFGSVDPFAGCYDGRDPFDDPFFKQPFGTMFGPSMPNWSTFGETSNAGFLGQAPPKDRSRRPIIEELSSDDESEAQKTDMEKGERPSMCSKESYVVQHPDEKAQEKGSAHNQFKNDIDHFNRMQLRGHSYAYRSSTVTYGGPNGAYYTSSTFKRTGTDGTVLEETKEDDATTGKATHKISCGIRDKGHTIVRILSSDGRVDTKQALHNLSEDEIPSFEKAWKGTA